MKRPQQPSNSPPPLVTSTLHSKSHLPVPAHSSPAPSTNRKAAIVTLGFFMTIIILYVVLWPNATSRVPDKAMMLMVSSNHHNNKVMAPEQNRVPLVDQSNFESKIGQSIRTIGASLSNLEQLLDANLASLRDLKKSKEDELMRSSNIENGITSPNSGGLSGRKAGNSLFQLAKNSVNNNDNSILDINRAANLNIEGRKQLPGGVVDVPANSRPQISPQQLTKLVRQREYLTVRYDRTSSTPYAPSLVPISPLTRDSTGGVHLAHLTLQNHRSHNRRHWLIKHPRYNPAIVAARETAFKLVNNGYKPAQLIIPPDDNSIFVTIASYRDEECAPTVLDMFMKAKSPENIYVGIVEQHDQSEDASCVPVEFGGKYNPVETSSARKVQQLKAFSKSTQRELLGVEAQGPDSKKEINPYSSWRNGGRPNGVGCQHDYGFCPTDNIRIRRIEPKHCKGPTFGRYLGFLMYKGEQFVFMMDSHNRFVTHWDTIIVEMYKKTKKEQKVRKPVLSHYPEAWNNPKENNGKNQELDHRQSTAYLCKANFLGWGIPRLEAIVVSRPPRALPQPWAAAGFLFADAALIQEVPFDPYLDYVFDGEEITYSVRMWTHGWNIFSPVENVIYHYYYRKGAKRFWGLVPANWGSRKQVAEKRIQYLLKATVNGTDDEYLVGKDTPSSVVIFFTECNGNQSCFEQYRGSDLSLTLPPGFDPQKTEYRHLQNIGRYSMGTQRSVEQWWAYSGMDRKTRKSNERKFCYTAPDPQMTYDP